MAKYQISGTIELEEVADPVPPNPDPDPTPDPQPDPDPTPGPGGILENPATDDLVPRPLRNTEATTGFLPQLGPFIFPEQGTQGIRLTNASVQHPGAPLHAFKPTVYGYFMQSNNHVGLDEITLLLKRDHRHGIGGNCIVRVDKETLMPSAPMAIFDDGDLFANPTAVECPTFSMIDPHMVRFVSAGQFWEFDVSGVDGVNLLDRDAGTVIVDAREKLGDPQVYLQAQVVCGTDRWYAATLKRRETGWPTLGIFLYDRYTDEHLVLGPFSDAECNLDLSGKWLLVRHHDYVPPSGLGGGVNRIYNLENGISGVLASEKLLQDIDGAGGHMDLGNEFFVTRNNWGPGNNKTELQDFRTPDYSGPDGIGGSAVPSAVPDTQLSPSPHRVATGCADHAPCSQQPLLGCSVHVVHSWDC